MSLSLPHARRIACVTTTCCLAGWIALDAPRARPRTATLAITGASIVARAGDDAAPGTIVITDGTITAIGSGVTVPPGADVLDAEGMMAYPGFLDGATSIGAGGDGRNRISGSPQDLDQDLTRDALAATRSVNRKGIFPDYAVAQNLRVSKRDADTWRAAGFAAAHSMPTNALIAGTSAVALLLDSADADGTRAIVSASTMLAAGWRAPGDDYPRSLMGSIAHLRQTFLDAQHYGSVWDIYRETNGISRRPGYDFALEALQPVLDGELPILFSAARQDEIDRALGLANEFDLRLVVDGGREAVQAVTRLQAARVPVLLRVDFPVEPRPDTPTLERLEARARSIGRPLTDAMVQSAVNADRDIRVAEPVGRFTERHRLWQEQVDAAATLAASAHPFAITTRGQRNATQFFANLRLAIAAGLSHDAAVDALTLGPAGILGVDRQLGSLEIGKIGNVTLLDGRLGEADARVRWVVVDGVPYEQTPAASNPSNQDDQSAPPEEETAEPAPSSENGWPVETDASRVPATRTGGDVLIRNATVLTMADAGVLPETDILVRDTEIVEIGRDLAAPSGITVVDAAGAWVMPGIIDDHSHMATDGGINEASLSITAQVRIEDVLRGDDLTLYRAAAGGVTTANVLHGSANTIGGQRAVIQMKYGVPATELLFDGYPRGIKFALGENVTRRRDRFPNTRMGQEAVIRRALTEAQIYQAGWDAYDTEVQRADRPLAPPRRDLRLETLAGILSGEILVHSHGYNADELFMLLRTLEEFGVRELTLEHALEAYKIAPEIVAFGNRGAFVSTFADNWAYKIEAYDAIPYNVALITEAGGRAIINSDSGERVRRLYVDAAKMVRFGGLTYRQALETITVNPAMALRIDDRVGSIEVGKRADLALFNGHPLNIYARVFMTLVGGEVAFERSGERGGPFPLEPKRPTPSGPAPQDANDRYAIANAQIHPVSGPTIPNGTLVFEDGRITAVGSDVEPPPGVTVVDAQGMSVYPGLIDGGSTLGLNEIGGVAVTQDSAESGVIQPDLRAAVAVKPDSELIPVARFTGITSAVSAPTGGLIPGQATLIQLAGWTPDELAYIDRLALQINIPSGAGELDIGTLLGQSRDPDDDTPTADQQLDRLRELFEEARAYADQQDQAAQAGQRLLSYDPALEALIPYARRDKPVILNANSAAAILVAIDLAAELDVRAILRGGQEAWRVADQIADAELPVLLSPLTRSPTDPYDSYDSVYASPLRLHEAGVTFGFQSNSGSGSRELPYQAGMAVAFGLPPDVALRSVTLSTAEILAVDDQVGSLEVGKRADIIVTDGDPLQAVSNVRYMFINGKPVDLNDNRHTRLYRQYQQRLSQP
jgi:imidazolonepropionase-like amidohydrolase